MRSKIVKRIISALLTATMLLTLSTTVFANEEEEKDYTVTYSAEEVTDIDSLIEMGLMQRSARDEPRSISDTIGVLYVNQMLEERLYDNGSAERDCVRVSIMLSREQAVAYSDKPLTNTEYQSYVPGYTLTTSFYYTERDGYPSAPNFRYRADKVVTTIVKTSATSNSVINADQMYKVSSSQEKWQTINFINSTPSGAQTFTLYSSHAEFYQSWPDILTTMSVGVCAQSRVNFSDGSYYGLQMIAWNFDRK